MRVPEEVYGSDLQGMDFKNQYIIHTLRENLQQFIIILQLLQYM